MKLLPHILAVLMGLQVSVAFVATIRPRVVETSPVILKKPTKKIQLPQVVEDVKTDVKDFRKSIRKPKTASITEMTDTIMTISEKTLTNKDRVDDIAHLIKFQLQSGSRPRAVVCSSMGKTTLLCAGKLALEGRACCADAVRTLFNSTMDHFNMTGSAVKEVNALLDEAEDILTGIRLLGELSPMSMDRLASYGERCSTRILSSRLNQIGIPAYAFDAWDVGMLTTSEYGHAEPLPEATSAIKKAFERIDPNVVAVVTGDVGHERGHHITRLGRGDMTAKALAEALGVKQIKGWKDVNGVLVRRDQKVGAKPTFVSMSSKDMQ